MCTVGVVYSPMSFTLGRSKPMLKPSRKILLVDGYNVINRLPELRSSLEGGLENAQNKLALHLSSWRRSHPDFECVIVFDGKPLHGADAVLRLAGIKCLFSRTPHGGDAAIIAFVRDFWGKTSDITVVSDDNYVRNNCRAHGASVQPSSFILVKTARSSGSRGRLPVPGKGIDRKAAAEIDRELKKKFGL
jgi:predicted RNA-binding protein with PIN domain